MLTELKVDYLDENVDVNSIVQDHTFGYYAGGEVVIVGKVKNSASNDATIKATIKAMSAAGPVQMDASSVRWVCPDYEYSVDVAPMFWRCCPPYPLGMVRWPCCWPDCCWGYYDYCLPKSPPVTPKPKPVLSSSTAGGFIERMWAYQSIKKLLKQADTNEIGDSASLKQKALELSLKVFFALEIYVALCSLFVFLFSTIL